MAPEAPNYIEKAKLNDTQEHELEFLHDPSKFDEAKLRKYYQGKLDKVLGGKMLTSPDLLKKYDEAKRQIEKNIQALREVRDYAVERTYAKQRLEWLKKTNPKFVGVEFVMYQLEFQKWQDFVKRPLTNVLAETDRRVFLADKSTKDVLKSTADKFNACYEKRFDYLNKLAKVVKDAPAGGLHLSQYDQFADMLIDFKIDVDDKFIGSSKSADFTKRGKDLLTSLKSVKEGMMAKLSKADQEMVRKLDSTIRFYGTSAVKGKESEKVNQEYSVAIEKDKALLKKEELGAYSAKNDTGLFMEGDKLIDKAVLLVKSGKLVEARKAYIDARSQYELSIAMCKTTKQKPDQQKMARINAARVDWV
ncbi:hypothetical protein IT411_00750 [Candidatus Peregrinibacteria bacterium]|nr:hypothetical protein [Candidatus Peregrinibacteria bacterium]